MDIFLFFIFLGACFAAGATGALFPPGDWYKRLRKPSWTPPNWVFPAVWSTLYILMAFAAARVAGKPGAEVALAFWALQMTVNALWSPVFFGLRRLRAAFPVMGMLWFAVLGALVTHWQVDLYAGLAFAPYLLWVTIAGALNFAVVQLNPDVEPLRPSQL